MTKYHLLKTIPVGGDGGWDYASVDSAAQRLYVSHGTKVVVIDLAKDAVVGEITNTPGVHGLAPAPELGRGMVTCGRENKAAIVDLITLQIVSKVDTGANPDGMLYEPGRQEFYTFNGRGQSATVIDAKTAKVVATIPLGGKPEFAQADPKAGLVFDNLEDKSDVVVIDAKKHEVVNRWPIAPGEEASGMAFDAKNHRLFLGCHNNMMVMMDSATEKFLAIAAIVAVVALAAPWETANYNLKPRFLQIPGVAKVEITGGRTPEYHVIVDPLKLQAAGLGLADVTDALTKNNLFAPAGMMEANYHLYLTTVDGRVRSAADIENMVIAVHGNHPIQIKDVARVERGPEPVFQSVTAQGRDAVLLNIQSQSDSSTLDIANALKKQLSQLRQELPPDMHLAFFYDQSLFVRDSVGSVWDAILFGLILSVLILYFFLKNWGSVWTAIVTIPITVLITLIAMKLANMSFNMMTLGGIAASIGLVIDNAIIVVEAMCVKIAAGRPQLAGIQETIGEILVPLIGSTLTPVVVFLPLAFLSGVTGVFFRALALTMMVSLLTSLVLALTLTPSLAAWFIRERKNREPGQPSTADEGGWLLTRVIRIYERTLRAALRFRWITLLACGAVLASSVFVYRQLDSARFPRVFSSDMPDFIED